MRLGTILRLWLPLALSFELMMLEGPAIQGAIGKLPDIPMNLAAWGLTMSLSLLIESPIIMLLATAIALVKDGDSFHALWRFMFRLATGCTLLAALISFTPLFDFVAGRLMGQPLDYVAAARPAMQIMLFWTAAIAWRRFYQGVLVRHGHTQKVTWGTAIRLASVFLSAWILVHWGGLPGVQVGAVTVMVAVFSEAIATTLFAVPIIRHQVLPLSHPDEPPLTQKAIWQFHAPLAASTLLTLLAQPLTATALARLPSPKETLAAWPVAYMALLVIRGWGLAVQEMTVAQARFPDARPLLREFAWVVGLVTAGVALLLAVTPLHRFYFESVIRLPLPLWSAARLGIGVAFLLPLITALGSWARGLLMASGKTKDLYWGMGVNLSAHGLLLTLGVLLHLPGMAVAACAFTLAAALELLYLLYRLRTVAVP